MDCMYTPKWLSGAVTDITKIVGGKLAENEKLVDASKEANKVIDKAGDVVDDTFDFFKWSSSNWQLLVIGAVALVVLLRD